MPYDFISSEPMSTDSPWDENPGDVQDAEWKKLSEDFTNAGYREGITAGKEAALQEGFDAGFALVGIPLGLELGILRGHANAFHSFLAALPGDTVDPVQISEARSVVDALAEVRFADIAPRDLEAEAHAREHLEMTGDELDENEEIAERRRVEQLEDMMGQLSASAGGTAETKRPTIESVRALRARLDVLCAAVGIEIDPQRS